MTPFLKHFSIFLFIFALKTTLFAQSVKPHIEWAKSFGGSEIDLAQSIEQTFDKGFIIAGASYSNDLDVAGHHGATDTYDYWIVKLDSNGNLEWQRSLGGASDNFANSIKQTPDSGYIVVGYSTSNNFDVTGNHGGEDYWVVRLDENGKIIWEKSFGGSRSDRAYAVELTTDGGFVVAGYTVSNDGDVTKHHGDTTNTDYWIIKLDHDGNLKWQKSFGGTNDDIAYSIRQTPDRGFIVAGSTYSVDGDTSFNHGTEDFWILKLDSMGSLLWKRSYGGSLFDEAHSIDLTSDGGYIAAGYSSGDNHGLEDFWIIKIDSTGNLLWQKSFGGSSTDAAYSIKQTFDGGYVVAGNTVSNDGDVTGNHGGNDYWIVKLDSIGNLQWQKTLGGPGEEFALCIRQTADSGYIVAGSSDFDGGDVNGNHNHEDFWIVKLGTSGKNEVSFSVESTKTGLNYPNPFSDKTIIQLSDIAPQGSSLILYNLLGVKLRMLNIPEGSKSISVERNGLAYGVYVYNILNHGIIMVKGTVVVQ